LSDFGQYNKRVMENEYSSQNRLTSGGDSPKLNEGDVYQMPDITNVEGQMPDANQPPKPNEAAKPIEEGTSGETPPQTEVNGGGNAGNGGERPPGPPPPENPQPQENPTPDDDNGEDAVINARGERSYAYYKKLYDEDPRPDGKFWKMLKDLSPHSGYSIDKGLIKLIAGLPEDSKPMYYLVNKIVALPLDNETAGYELGLTARGNIDTIFSELREAVLNAPTEGSKNIIRGRAERVRSTYEAVSILHNMNKGIVTSGIKEFDRLAEEITPEQQQILQEVNGAALVMRLFEDEYQRILMNDKTVTTEKNDELRSKHRPEQSVLSKKSYKRLGNMRYKKRQKAIRSRQILLWAN
jgi:hypothetical protein